MSDGLTREHVIWAYRLLLDREPESEDVIAVKRRAWRTTQELRLDIMASEEFGLKNPDHASAAGPRVVITQLDDGCRLFVDLADHVIGRPIVRGGYETSEVRLATSLVGEGDVAVDVGAHIGFFTVQLARTVGSLGHVYAFEPQPANARLLSQSIRENGFESRVTLREAAVSNRAGAATFVYSERSVNSGGGFLDIGHSAAAGLASRSVETVRLDDLGLRRPVRLIKLDVEGAEPWAIEGAAAIIATDRPAILCEVHPAQLARVAGATPASLFSLVASLGLRPHRIVDGRIGSLLVASDVRDVTTIVFAA